MLGAMLNHTCGCRIWLEYEHLGDVLKPICFAEYDGDRKTVLERCPACGAKLSTADLTFPPPAFFEPCCG